MEKNQGADRYSFDLKKQILYNEFRSHWTGKSAPVEGPNRLVAYKDLLAELCSRARKKQQLLKKNNQLLGAEGPASKQSPQSACGADIFLTVHDTLGPTWAGESPVQGGRIAELTIQMGIESQKHQRLKLDSFKLSEQISLYRRSIGQLRERVGSLQPLSHPALCSKSSAQCLQVAERRYRFLASEQSRLIDMQNRLYLEQHQSLMDSEEHLLSMQVKTEVLRKRAKVLHAQLGAESHRGDTMNRKITQERSGGGGHQKRLAAYAQIENFIEQVEGPHIGSSRKSGDRTICSINSIEGSKEELEYRTSRVLSFYKRQLAKGQDLLQLYQHRLQVVRALRSTLQGLDGASSALPALVEPSVCPPASPVAAKDPSTPPSSSMHKAEERRNSSLSTVLAFEQRCLYIFRRCMKIVRLIFTTWNKYDSTLMGKLYGLEEVAKAELKDTPWTREDLAQVLKRHFENWQKYLFWVQEIAKNKFLGRYLPLQLIEKEVTQTVVDKKQRKDAKTQELLWKGLVSLNLTACKEAIHRVKFSLSKTLEVIKICKETRKPIINRAVKRAFREQSQPLSIHRQDTMTATQAPSSIPLKKIIQKLVSKQPLWQAQNDLAQKEKQLQVYRFQLFSHRGKSTPTTSRSRRKGKFELLRNYPSTRLGSHVASPRTSINYEVSETWIE